MATYKKAYISSTSVDLAAYRKRVMDIILRFGVFPIVMEEFISTEKNALQLTYDNVQQADIFIGIYAQRYGYVPGPDLTYVDSSDTTQRGDGQTSIIEWEYRWAAARKIPMLLFLLSDSDSDGNPVAWPTSYIEGEPGASRLRALKSLLQTRYVVGLFSNPDHLASQVALSLASVLKEIPEGKGKSDEVQTSVVTDIPNLDERMLNAVLKALEVSDVLKLVRPENPANPTDPETLCIKPIFALPASRRPQYLCDVFVIMPFAEDFQAVYSDAIKPACDDLGLEVKRGDDLFANDYIMEEIWFAMNNCKLVIADCTGRNPNVFYELGIAHTLVLQPQMIR